MRILRALARATRGVATIEFALWMTFIFLAMLATFDVARFSIQRGQLAQAVSGASIAAFRNRAGVDYAAIPGYVRAASAAPAAAASQMTIRVGCNGGTDNCTNTNRSCACLSRTGTFVPVNSCGVTCGSSATASSVSGYYLRISTSYPFTPAVLPRGVFGDAQITQSSTIRLQ